jgi:hypothetical protein
MSAGYDRSVFINCPFDDRYLPLFQALVFVVQDCGFLARCAREVEDSGEERIRKIKRINRECRYGVHDISRVQLDKGTGLPRFNMPLELGLFMGAQEYGPGEQQNKRSIVLDTEKFRYQAFCSDIAGQDIRAHGNQAGKAIAAVRGMLATALGGAERVPGEAKITERFTQFRKELPGVCRNLHVKPKELQFVEMRSLIEEWVTLHPLG